MIPIRCRTNLDLEACDKTGFPKELPAVPRVGDLIQSKHLWTTEKAPEYGGRYKVHLELIVGQVTWKYAKPDWAKEESKAYWIAEIELTVPPSRYPDEKGVCNMIGFY